MKYSESINVILQSLARVAPLRDFFLLPENYAKCKSGLVQKYGEWVRKIWNPRNFKAQVSPHELLQEISAASAKKYRIGQRSDPIDFLSWFLNTLHSHLSKKNISNIIHDVFQGQVEVKTKTKTDEPKVEKVPFLYLSVDVPPAPLFKNEMEANIIPQVPLYTCLEKYDGISEKLMPTGEIKTYQIRQLPRFLIVHIKRFTKNNFFVEKNPTIVNFPIKNLELKDYVISDDKKEDEKAENESNTAATTTTPTPKTKYDLLATIKHEGKPNEGTYSAYVLHKGNDKWFEVQDLIVTETMPQLIALSEAYIQFYELK
eukprot:TRINITY_DN6438_c0_g1_i2.p1 TRINITY_DN6438_c0_g1~~TRINITY_DN6438_c0_g1_i2.p1  ORF type:complete len:324 (-),score=99.58 TRINITY_DN6438_c0_g1_i2:74-1018(-)